VSAPRYCSRPTGYGEKCDAETTDGAEECDYHSHDDSGDVWPDDRCDPDEAIAAQLAAAS
jgi:hypothetical protein